MAQIPGVPDKEPAQIDHLSAGRGGQAIARIGEDIEGMTQDEFSIHNHIREAQKHVDTLAFQNQAHASVLQTQMELKLYPSRESRNLMNLQRHTQRLDHPPLPNLECTPKA
jgi:hypothetical protein